MIRQSQSRLSRQAVPLDDGDGDVVHLSRSVAELSNGVDQAVDHFSRGLVANRSYELNGAAGTELLAVSSDSFDDTRPDLIRSLDGDLLEQILRLLERLRYLEIVSVWVGDREYCKSVRPTWSGNVLPARSSQRPPGGDLGRGAERGLPLRCPKNALRQAEAHELAGSAGAGACGIGEAAVHPSRLAAA
jgi:hypothetical protein